MALKPITLRLDEEEFETLKGNLEKFGDPDINVAYVLRSYMRDLNRTLPLLVNSGWDLKNYFGFIGFWLKQFGSMTDVEIDTKIALLRQGPRRPVSVSIRPSITSLVGPSEVWVGTWSIDLSASRAVGPVSPYAGIAASTSLGIERSEIVKLDPATAERSFAYAGLSYRWRALILSGRWRRGPWPATPFVSGRGFERSCIGADPRT